jgi:hypothetical protein
MDVSHRLGGMGCGANWQGQAFLISMFDVRWRNGMRGCVQRLEKPGEGVVDKMARGVTRQGSVLNDKIGEE